MVGDGKSEFRTVERRIMFKLKKTQRYNKRNSPMVRWETEGEFQGREYREYVPPYIDVRQKGYLA